MAPVPIRLLTGGMDEGAPDCLRRAPRFLVNGSFGDIAARRACWQLGGSAGRGRRVCGCVARLANPPFDALVGRRGFPFEKRRHGTAVPGVEACCVSSARIFVAQVAMPRLGSGAGVGPRPSR